MTHWLVVLFFFSSRRRHTRLQGDWSSDVCSSDLQARIISPMSWSQACKTAVTPAISTLAFYIRPKDRSRVWRVGCPRSEEHTSELQSPCNLVCRLLLEKKKKKHTAIFSTH